MNNEFLKLIFKDFDEPEFNKYTKKNISEDYIKENLRLKGWECYAPLNDTGIDLIAIKLNDGQPQYRYIQIKTRSLVNNNFGFTLNSKDFITDPRKFFLLYCDDINDVLFISVRDYLEFFKNNSNIKSNHFSTNSFRKGNNKQNSLNYDLVDNNWYWGSDLKKRISMSKFCNQNGFNRFISLKIDDNLMEGIDIVCKLKFDLFYECSNNEFLKPELSKINEFIKLNVSRSNNSHRSEQEFLLEKLKKEDFIIYESHNKYLVGDE